MHATESRQESSAERQPVLIEHFDVAGLSAEDAFASLVTANRSSRLTRLSEGPFAASARFWQMGQQIWVDQWLDPLIFERDLQLARSIPLTHYSIIVILDGQCTLVRTPANVVCSAGDVIVTDVSRPECTHATRVHSLHIRVPRASLDAIIPPIGLHGRLPRSAAASVFVEHAVGIARTVQELDQAQAALLAASTCYHLAAALIGIPAVTEESDGGLPRERAKRYMAEQPNGTISVDAICRALGVTRPTLYRAFKADGGVLAYDRKRRLVGLHQALSNRLERRPIVLLGVEYGFPDREHMSRIFREAFGYTPTQLRAHAGMQPHHDAKPGSVQDAFLQAIHSLNE